MNILEKIFDKLNISFLNRRDSSSIKAGRDVIVNNSEGSQRAAVITAGKRATFVSCTMKGPSGLIDRGEDTAVVDSNIQSTGGK